MMKYVVLIFNLLSFFPSKASLKDDINITQSVPAIAKSGSEFIVELTLNTSDVKGLAKLQQDLPEGFTAVKIENRNASFSFSNQSVKLIWQSIPSENALKISYKVLVSKNTSGTKMIGGKFTYVSNNVKEIYEITPSSIAIIGEDDPSYAAASDVSITPADTTIHLPDTANTSPQSLFCKRYMPSEASKEFIVEITLNKGDISGFSKLEEILPDGFSATAIESNTASFTFTEQKAKFVWVSLPAENKLKVSYKVKIDKNSTGTKSINGTFSYLENDETKKYIINSSTINIIAVTNENNNAEAVTPKITTTTPANKVAVPKSSTNSGKKTASSKKSASAFSSAVTIPSAENGIVYRVQLAASRKTWSASFVKRKFKLSRQIYYEMHDGWTKYTVGSFKEYKLARDYRNNIKNKGIKGPFVTAYNNGKRITVQEALTISGQTWFK